MFQFAATILAAIAAAAGAGFAAPSLLGRSLASYELLALAAACGVMGWGLAASMRRRQRKRMLGMRDSALW
ncbi:hypothetical protein ACFPOE_23600 [Caenimonas terrae]|uniref:Uncharacterized protein n=1 Tax=Caenimonas terrae TaxID=696074 RepID=A0ABW0NLU3_9BURK